MKFNEFIYQKPDLNKIAQQIKDLIRDFEAATDFNTQNDIFTTFNKIRDDIDTNMTIVSVRYAINTTDEYYANEQDYLDENSPKIQDSIQNFLHALYASKFKVQFKKKYGALLFKSIEVALKTFKPEIIAELQEENKLITKYSKLMASAKIAFDGKELNLSQLSAYKYSLDRNIRKDACFASANWMMSHLDELDTIYDNLVKVRTAIAHKLGYKNFVQLGYDRMGRVDYNASKVKNYRKQIYEDLLPLTKKLRKRQMQRVNISKPKYYDWSVEFLSGNPKPNGDKDFMIKQATIMYQELSNDTNEFFTMMKDRELLDLETKPNKSGGGFCTYMPNYKAPFIFSNFNGTKDDVDVLTHEFGHAFQAYLAKDFIVSEYRNPTMEACEIHSMSMEFLAWPWMDLFFGDAVEKYRFSHLSDALNFMPYGAAVDEFQHVVYENPALTPQMRRQAWLDIHHKYEPHLDVKNIPFLEIGGRFMYQSHIYEAPFYYIDYTLAQVCALNFLNLSNINRKYAWEVYMKLCKLGGSKSFLNLLNAINFKSPFEDGCIKEIIKPIKKYLDSIDDTKL